MLKDILLALVQSATEFLPVSSSGHLSVISKLISEPDLFFFTVLHLASLLAVIIFTRREIKELLNFSKESRGMWSYIIAATIPAVLVGLLFKNSVEKAFSSFLFIGLFYLFTAVILYCTRFAKNGSEINFKKSVIIGLAQALALFPGVSRSGITISTALFTGIDREKAARFSFLLFIPLCMGAFLLELGEGGYFSLSLFVSFIVCLIGSLFFLKLLLLIVRKGVLWMFSVYCLLMGFVCFGLALGR